MVEVVMRIAQIAPLCEAVPPKLYGGTERVVANLCNALVELGHDVTLFATAESRTRARLVQCRDQAMRLDTAPLKSDVAAHLTMLYEVRRRHRQFDVLHFHIDMLQFPIFEAQAHKCVTTLHGRLDLKDVPPLYRRWSQFGLVSISDAQRAPLTDAHWLRTVFHGLPPEQFPFQECGTDGYLAFLGRISPEKRPDVAIRLALRTGLPLKIAAKVDPVDAHYFRTTVQPLLENPLIEFIGEIEDSRKASFLGGARALLFPIDWPEPFGLVMIEAMACGTPIIGWKRGAVPEVIEPNVSGFLVSSEAEAVDAIARLPQLSRAGVRRAFEHSFTATVMANSYLDVYKGLLHQPAAILA
jgi:glycosyltransferase involved in cell wall biosynthesis